MSDPSLALQAAVFAALNSAPAVAGGRIYDRVPPSPVFPYVSFGEGDTVGDDNECFASSEATVTVHVWSRALGLPEVKGIAATVRDRLSIALAVTGFRVTNGEHVITRFLRDPDGITSHAVVECRYLIDHDYL